MEKSDLESLPPGKLAKMARMLARKTQAEIARLAKLNRSKLALYESGMTELSPAENGRLQWVFEKLKVSTEKIQQHFQKSLAASHADWSKDARRIDREFTGLSQHQVAKVIGVSQSRLSEWERGRAILTAEQEHKVSELLKGAVRQNPFIDEIETKLRLVDHRADQIRRLFAMSEKAVTETIDEHHRVVEELKESLTADQRRAIERLIEPITRFADQLLSLQEEINEEGQRPSRLDGVAAGKTNG